MPCFSIAGVLDNEVGVLNNVSLLLLSLNGLS